MKKFRLILSIILLLLLIVANVKRIFAAEYSPSTSYSLGTTVDSYAKGILQKQGLTNYVVWRAGQYQYYVAVGDLEESNGVFTGNDITVYSYNTSTYNTPVIGKEADTEFKLTTNNILVKSNLTDYYPNVEGVRNYETLAILFVLVFGVGTWFFLSLIDKRLR